MELSDKKLLETHKILEQSGRVLTFYYILEKLIERKLLRNDFLEESRLWSAITERCEIFITISSFKHAAVGLKKWIPYKKFKKIKNILLNRTNEIQYLLKKNELDNKDDHVFTHKLSSQEIKESFIFISNKLLELYNYQGTGFNLNIYCYGSYNFLAWINTESKTIHSENIGNFFKDNKLKKGDLIFLIKREDDPAGIHLYTKWQNYIDKDRINQTEKRKKIKPTIKDNKKTIDNIDNSEYLLALIQKKDLVYKFLFDNGPSYYYEIANAFCKYLGSNRNELDKLSFIDFEDKRLTRLENGKIGIILDRIGNDNINDPIKLPVNNYNLKYYAIIIAIALLGLILFIAIVLL